MSIAVKDFSFFSRCKISDAILLAFFIVCLTPITVGKFSVNYLFVVYPVWLLVSGRRMRWPPFRLLLALISYVVIFVGGLLVDTWSGENLALKLRSLLSFLIFVSVFGLIFFDLTAREIKIFKLSVLAAALMFALIATFNFYWAGGNDVGVDQKDIVGSQRYGFVYFMAFCIAMSKRPSLNVAIVGKIVVVGLLLAGMLLTFSRSTIITFGVVVIFYTLAGALENRRNLSNWTRELVPRALLVIGCLVGLAFVMPLPFEFYGARIFERYVSVVFGLQPEITEDVFNPIGSEGTRVVLWTRVIDYVTEHPIFGSRYLGIWTIDGAPSGSAHNQLMDVLLRTGWLGLGTYLYLLGWLLFCLFRVDRSLFWGFLGVLVYGFFHETFKESQGAFLLTFMMGVLATSVRSRHSAKTERAALRKDIGSGDQPLSSN